MSCIMNASTFARSFSLTHASLQVALAASTSTSTNRSPTARAVYRSNSNTCFRPLHSPVFSTVKVKCAPAAGTNFVSTGCPYGAAPNHRDRIHRNGISPLVAPEPQRQPAGDEQVIEPSAVRPRVQGGIARVQVAPLPSYGERPPYADVHPAAER